MGGGRQRVVLAVALVLVPFALLGHGLLPGRVLSPADNLLAHSPWRSLAPDVQPANPLMGDVTGIFHTGLVHLRREVHAGRIPLWNPHVFTGAPFLANPHFAPLFPLTALAWMLPLTTAIGLIAILKLAAAGLAMWAMLRVLHTGPLPAAVGALTYMLSGPMIVWLQWSFASTLIFPPLLIALTERVRAGGGLRWTALLALAVGTDLLAGYPQGAFVGIALATAWALARASHAADRLAFAARYVGAVAAGIALAAVHLVPFVEYLAESSVFAYRREWIPPLHLPMRSVIALLMPHYFGGPAAFRGDWNFNEVTTSAGIVPLLTLPLAAVLVRRRVGGAFFLVVAAVAAPLLYGAPMFTGVATLPGLSFVQTWRLAQPVLTFALAALAALTLDEVAREGVTRPRATTGALWLGFAVVVATGWAFVAYDFAELAAASLLDGVLIEYAVLVTLVTMAAVGIARWMRAGCVDSRWGLAILAVQLASLLPLAATYNPAVDARWFYARTPAIDFLESDRARERSRVLLGYNAAGVYGLYDPAGHDGMTPRRLQQIVGPPGPSGAFAVVGSESVTLATVFSSPAYELLSVRYVVQPPRTAAPGAALSVAYDGPDARVYRDARALPRAFFVPAARCVGDEEAIEALRGRRIDLRREVLLAGCTDAPPPGGVDPAARVAFREDASDRVVLDVTSAAPAYLLLTDTWFPGWTATVDGAPVTLWRANHAFRAVAVPAGRHQVAFVYAPRSFRVGLSITAVTAAVIAFALIAPSRKRSAAA